MTRCHGPSSRLRPDFNEHCVPMAIKVQSLTYLSRIEDAFGLDADRPESSSEKKSGALDRPRDVLDIPFEDVMNV